ncbi:hypothetical protein AZOA_12080 [Azoarcus sp. Aa7]|nr:hypothetical protein [Azoarcus sp. Aa7]
MNYHSTTIAQILSRINRDVLIPGIQRPYVWETEQIIRLFDSLMRGYPINSFLFWELQPENFNDWDIYKFVRHFQQGNIHNDRAKLNDAQAATLVLDGQQRLTSLLIGLTGSYRVKNGKKGRGSAFVEQALFLNLLESPHGLGDSDEDEVVVRDIHYGFKFVDTERRPKNSSTAIWFKVSDILGIANDAQLAATIERELTLYPLLETDQRTTLKNNLNRLHHAVWKEDCIAYYMERDQSYDKVLDIFIRANDGGTKLSKSDLLMSMVTLRWERLNARDETEALTYHLREVLEQDKAFDRDYLLRSGLFFNDLDFAFQLRNFTPRNIAIIESRWAESSHALRMSADLFSRIRVTGGHLTGTNAVMLVGCYIFKLNRGRPLGEWSVTPDDEERIRRWIIAVLYHGVLGGAANVTMELYRRILNEQLALSTAFPVRVLTERMTKRGRVMDFDDDTIARFCATEAKTRLGQPALSLLYDRVDWRTESFQLVQIMPSHRLLDERLQAAGVETADIPATQSWASRLANFALMSAEEAREYYQMDFEDWVASRTPADFARHRLPADPALYDEFCFIDFITARRQLIADRMRTLLTSPDAVPSQITDEDEALA